MCECIIQESVDLVHTIYDKFRRMPPMLQKSSLIATAAVAEAGLLQVKEEYDLVESILRDDATAKGVADETRLEYEKTKVILEWIDKVIAAIHEEKGRWTVSWSPISRRCTWSPSSTSPTWTSRGVM